MIITKKLAITATKTNVATIPLSHEEIVSLSENVIGKFLFNAPLHSLRLNGRVIAMPVAYSDEDMGLHMATAQQLLGDKSIQVTFNKPLMDVQLLLSERSGSTLDIQQIVTEKKTEWLAQWNDDLKQKGRHGTVENITLRALAEGRFVLDITMNTEDSMGAAMVNRLASEVIPQIREVLCCEVDAFILSNDVPERWAKAEVTLSKDTLEAYGITDEQLEKDVSIGVLRGILGAAIPTFNDTRAINEAISIATSSTNLLSHSVDSNGDVTFTVTLPLPVGSQGRPRLHPGSHELLCDLGNPRSMELAADIVSMGLLSGLAHLIESRTPNASPKSVPERKSFPIESAPFTQQFSYINQISKMSFEQRQKAVGWVQPIQEYVDCFELPLVVVPNVRVYTESEEGFVRADYHLFGVTEEKTVSVAMAVAAKIITESGQLKATVSKKEGAITVDMRLELMSTLLGFKDKNGREWTSQEVVDGIKRIIDWELLDERRAVTGGKGEQNGGIAIATALGTDWVKIMHDFSKQRMSTGHYKPCVTYVEEDGKFILKGTYSFDKEALVHNEDDLVAREVLSKLNNPDPQTRAVMIAVGCILSRLMALRMLGTFGVDAGHRQVTTT